MIEAIMFIGIGFLVATLGLLVFVPLVHGRAVRLTTRKLEASMPISKKEIAATRDLLRAEFALSARRFEQIIDDLKEKNTTQLVALSKKEDALNCLNVDAGNLRYQLRVAEEDIAQKTKALNDTEHDLSVKEPERARLASELEQKAAQVNTQTIEIVALKTQIETLKDRLAGADNELKATENLRTLEHSQLEATARSLAGERGKFEAFYRRVAEIEQRLAARSAEDRMQAHQTREELESRLTVQTRLLKERERELQLLRRELDLARKAEADLRVEIIAGDERVSAVLQAFQAEKNNLQAMLERAQAECARLNFELTTLKRLVGGTQAA